MVKPIKICNPVPWEYDKYTIGVIIVNSDECLFAYICAKKEPRVANLSAAGYTKRAI